MSISIITACFNNLSTIECCRQSVKSQSIPAEQVFIDGVSTDGTADWLRKTVVKEPAVRFVSEPDQGIYDAMNKGIRLASGDIIGTLNADDYYADERVLARVTEVMSDTRIDACYGDIVYVHADSGPFLTADKSLLPAPSERVIRTWHAGTQGEKWSRATSAPWSPRALVSNPWLWGWMPPHPTLFVRRHILETLGLFRLDLGTSADYELMLRLLNKHRLRCAYIPEVLVKMRIGGVSTRSLSNRLKAHLNDWKAWRVNGLCPFPWTVPMKPLRKIGQWTAD
jgi:glycosyltransferase